MVEWIDHEALVYCEPAEAMTFLVSASVLANDPTNAPLIDPSTDPTYDSTKTHFDTVFASFKLAQLQKYDD